MGNKFVLEGDEINSNNEPDEQGEESKDLVTMVDHDPDDRQADGTSRWCWCHPFYNKSSFHIAGIIEKFINFINEKIICLTTDCRQ